MRPQASWAGLISRNQKQYLSLRQRLTNNERLSFETLWHILSNIVTLLTWPLTYLLTQFHACGTYWHSTSSNIEDSVTNCSSVIANLWLRFTLHFAMNNLYVQFKLKLAAIGSCIGTCQLSIIDRFFFGCTSPIYCCRPNITSCVLVHPLTTSKSPASVALGYCPPALERRRQWCNKLQLNLSKTHRAPLLLF